MLSGSRPPRSRRAVLAGGLLVAAGGALAASGRLVDARAAAARLLASGATPTVSPVASGTPASATPGATPVGATPVATSGNAVAVAIKNFAYNPSPVTVPVGATVTWTNEDSVPHTVTGLGSAKAIIKSGVMKTGAKFSVTFDKAGEYDYYCEFHAGMKGKVIVK